MNNKKELIFIISGIILLSISAVFVFYSINFLVVKINAALDIEADSGQEIPRLDFEGLKKIGIIKE